MEIKVKKTSIKLIKADITRENVDAIVNAANSSLMGGGGVDGAIHRAGGIKILEECKKIVAESGSLATGEAVITSGGNLPAKFVIHTVGPVWHGGASGEAELLKNAYFNSLNLGAAHNLKSIAFPSISTGVYGFPIEKASLIAFNTVKDFIKNNRHSYDDVIFVVFSESDFEVYKKIFV
jgi:O-acetyl-ADP-ribose deacetylase